jgi:phosphatidylglycerophosphatase A
VGFVVFRILDILKPPPINTVQRRFKGALAIVGDDLLAGLGTMILMRFLSGLEII